MERRMTLPPDAMSDEQWARHRKVSELLGPTLSAFTGGFVVEAAYVAFACSDDEAVELHLRDADGGIRHATVEAAQDDDWGLFKAVFSFVAGEYERG